MTNFSIAPAAEFPLAQIADLLTRGFAGYLVPIQITEPVLLTMLRRDSIDLAESRIIYKEAEAVGVALLARRGWTSRLAAMGIVATARNGGLGVWAMRKLIQEAQARGDQEMHLEVIAQNTAGVKLYQKAGFKKVRNLFGYTLEKPPAASTETLQEIDIRELARLVAYHGLKDLPWQLSGITIAQHTPPARAFRLNDAYCLISDPTAEHVAIASVLVKTRSRGAGLAPALLRALFARFPNKTWHVPPIYPEEICGVFEELDMQRAEIAQWQMRLNLLQAD
ncbi:MAG: GNAT family N-acetyltransferase [Anaerolineales bacterium]|nr:GNAT family N-acetyltransferase [Anaerolineales bacterium]